MSNTVLDALGLSVGTFEQAKVEPSTGKEVKDSGAYKYTIKQAVIYETKGGAKMLKTTFVDDNDEEYIDYANTSYIAKKDNGDTKKGSRVENKQGAHLLKALLSAVKMEPKDIVLTDTTIETKDNKEQPAQELNIAGRMVVLLIRKIEDEGSEYPESNQIEGVADIENKINGDTEAYDKWMSKIQKMPVLKRKAKGGGATATASSSQAKEAAKSLLD